VDVEGAGDEQQVTEPGVVLTELNPLNRRPVNARPFGELLLGEAGVDAGSSDAPT